MAGIATRPGFVQGTHIVTVNDVPCVQLEFGNAFDQRGYLTVFWRGYTSRRELYEFVHGLFGGSGILYRAVLDFDDRDVVLPLAPHRMFPFPHAAEQGVCETYGEPNHVRYELVAREPPSPGRAYDNVLWAAIADDDELISARRRKIEEQETRKEIGFSMYVDDQHFLESVPLRWLVENTLIPNGLRSYAFGLLEEAYLSLQKKIKGGLHENAAAFQNQHEGAYRDGEGRAED